MALKSALFCLSVASAAFSSFVPLSVQAVPAPEPSLSERTTGPAKEALALFEGGQHAKAVELAASLAKAGDPDALYLMGFASESGQGVAASQEKAIEFYRKATAKGQKDATYRLSFILLASDDEKDRTEARTALEAAAKSDPAVAGRILGEAWLRGRLSPEGDFDQAAAWWTKAGEVDDVPSLLLLARLYEGQFGFSAKKDLKRANNAYLRAAELGDAGAMVAIGSRLLNAPEAQRNEEKGREWLKKAAEAKDYSAYLVLGDFEENVKNDPKAALEIYRKGDDVGQVDCTFRTAEAYLEGKGVEKDLERGIKLLEKAAQAGSAGAHLRLAVIRFTQEKPEFPVGYAHLTSAAAGGLAEAQNEMALLYLSNKLGAADPVAAVAWLSRAAQAGYAPAQNNLATLYERGMGVQKDMGTAGQLYAVAANQGHGPATFALARLLVSGEAGQRDLPKAWALARLAGERQQENGDKLAKELEAQFSPEQKAQGMKELQAFRSGESGDQASGEAAPTQ